MRGNLICRILRNTFFHCFLLVNAGFGQTVTGTILGTVRDPAAAMVPKARVVCRNVSTGAEWMTHTSEDGAFRFWNLPPAAYIIEVDAEGFRKTVTKPCRLSLNDTLRQDIQLELSSTSESVTVEISPTLVELQTAELGQTERDFTSLPLLSGPNGRNTLSLAATQPGVVFAGQLASQDAGRFSVNGQRAQSDNYMLDGTDSNDLAANTPDSVQVISPNVVEEFRIITGPMKAEYGRNSGATIQVLTRSGGNTLHMSMSETFRNNKLNAVPFFQKSVAGGTTRALPNGAPRKPQWNSNDFDATVTGPLVKNRSFFTIGYLGFRRRQGVFKSATVFSDAQRQAIETVAMPEARALLSLIPRASAGNTLFIAPSNARSRNQLFTKIDHNFSTANHFSASYFFEDMPVDSAPFAAGGSSVPSFGANNTQRYQNIILQDTHWFSSALLNELRVSYHRNANAANVPQNRTPLRDLGLSGIIPDDPSAEGPPYVVISGYSPFGNTIQGPQGRADNTYQYLDNLSWNHGKHSFKFGGELRTYAQNQFLTFMNNGYIVIDGSGTLLGMVPQTPGLPPALNDFAHGFATFFAQNSAGRAGYRTGTGATFAQDDWKVFSRLTLNLGLRWEYNTGLKEVHNKVAAFRPGLKSVIFPDAPLDMVFTGDHGISRSTYREDFNNFGPRFGFAWDVLGNAKMSLRGGYGVFYDTPMAELSLPFLTTAPFSIQSNLYYVRYANPFAGKQNPFPFQGVSAGGNFDFASVAPIPLTVMDPDFATPYGQQWSLELQYQLPGNWLFQTGYVGSSGVKLLDRRNINPALPGPGATVGNTNARRVYNINHPEAALYKGTPFSYVTNQLTDANSNYNSLQLSATKRLAWGLHMSHAYTWGHAIDNISGIRGSQSRVDNARADRGNSEQDVRHRYVMTYYYELPWMKNQSGILGKLLGKWSIAGVNTFQTGLVFDIIETEDRCLCDSGGQRPDYIGGKITFFDPRSPSAVPGRPNSWFDGTGGATATAAASPFFRRVGSAASWAAGAGRFGNLGRNVFHGPGINNWDFAATKQFVFAEKQNLQVRAEFFNLFNHTQFLNPDSSIASVNFGRVMGSRDPRIIQFSLRYEY
jgi:hypothetical protein